MATRCFRRAGGRGWGLVLAAVLACETAAPEQKPTPGPEQAVAPKDTLVTPSGITYDGKLLARQMRTLDALTARADVKARDEYLRSQITDPGDIQAKFLTAYAIDDRRVAWRELDSLRKAYPGSALGYVGILAVYAEWKIVDEAIKARDGAVKLDPALAVVHARMGHAHQAKGQTEKAVAAYGEALRLDPDDADALVGLARIARAADKKDEALAGYDRAAPLWPESLGLIKERAGLLEEMGRRKDAAQAYLVAARIDRRPYDLYLRAAALIAQEGDRTVAEDVYKQALQVNPNDANILSTLAQLAAERGDKDAQRGYLARAVEGKPDDLELQRALAFIYLDKGENAGAERHLLEVLRLKPEDQEAHVALARIYDQQGKIKETMEHLEEAAAIGPLDDKAARMREGLQKKLMLPLTRPSGKDVNKTFDAALKTIIACYTARTKAVPKLSGSVTVEVEVGEDGNVKVARLKEDSLRDEILLANIYFTLKMAKFPDGKKARYSYPISFKKGGK